MPSGGVGAVFQILILCQILLLLVLADDSRLSLVFDRGFYVGLLIFVLEKPTLLDTCCPKIEHYWYGCYPRIISDWAVIDSCI